MPGVGKVAQWLTMPLERLERDAEQAQTHVVLRRVSVQLHQSSQQHVLRGARPGLHLLPLLPLP